MICELANFYAIFVTKFKLKKIQTIEFFLYSAKSRY